MFIHETKIRVRYAETDQMRYVYYGVYATYFEVARVEALRSLACSYKFLEDSGILMPVSHFEINYIKPAFYDEELLIRTCIPELPLARIHFTYETFNMQSDLLNTASTELFFASAQSNKPVRIPSILEDVLKKYF